MKTGTSKLMDSHLVDFTKETIVTSNTTTGEYAFYSPCEVVGGYRMGKQGTDYIQFNITYKPNWFHRQMMKLCLGWYWYDAK